MSLGITKRFFGDGQWTCCPLSYTKNSFQAITLSLLLEFFKNFNSALSTLTHENFALAMLLSILQITCNGASRNVLLQMAGHRATLF